MSFILDALRRAEAERERGAVPGLHSQATVAVSATSRDAGGSGAQSVRWLVPGVLLLLLLAGSAMALWWRGQSQVAVTAGPAAAAPATSAAAEPAVVHALAGVASATSAPTASANPQPVPTPVTLPVPTRAPEIRPSVETVPSAPSTSTPLAAQPPRPRAATAAARPASLPAAAVAATSPVSIDALPEPWRGTVARLAIGGAVHSANSAQSFVIVGGQLVHEGDSVAAQVVVERIGPRSVLLRAGPHRVEIGY